MLKVVLKCKNSNDCRIVTSVLIKLPVLILKTKESLYDTSRRITFVVSDYTVMNEILFEVSQQTYGDVQVVKVKQTKIKNMWGSKYEVERN